MGIPRRINTKKVIPAQYILVFVMLYKSFYRVLKTKSTTSSKAEVNSAPDT